MIYNNILHCLECDKKEECSKCTSDYTPANENKLCILTQDITDKKYYLDTDNNNFYYECSTSLEHCLKFENKAKCLECIALYVIEENDICIPYSLFNDKLYYLDNGKYHSCSKIPNCEKCTSNDKCIMCKENFYLIKDSFGNFICENVDTSKYYSSIEGDITFYI